MFLQMSSVWSDVSSLMTNVSPACICLEFFFLCVFFVKIRCDTVLHGMSNFVILSGVCNSMCGV